MEAQKSNTTKRVPIAQIREGMYVVGLDRSWIETPFLFHRKRIKSSADIELLKKHGIREVVIDTARGADVDVAQNGQAGANSRASVEPLIEIRQAQPNEIPFRILIEEFEIARKVHDEALAASQAIFDGAGRGAPIPSAVAQKVVSDLTSCILRSPDASLLLTHMRRFQNDLFTHAVNVCVLSLVVSAAEGLESENGALGFGALLHDIGQTRLPRNLIRKSEPYTDSERRLLEQHPRLGYKILERSESIPDLAARILIEHHERVNGAGYPGKLEGEAISPFSQIVAITDAYDAMLIGRNHPALQPIEILREIYLDAQKGLFDRVWVEKVIRALGVYPIGSLVELNTGEKGIVIAANRADSLRPTLRIIAWPSGHTDCTDGVVNLADPGTEAVERRIVRVLDPGKERIDIIEQLQSAAGHLVH